MELRLNWVASSLDCNKLRELKDFFEDLKGRSYPRGCEHKIPGCETRLYDVDGVYYLVGCWIGCAGFDAGYWLNLEGKNSLLEGVNYFEPREGNNTIVTYLRNDNDECFMLADTDVIGDMYSGPLCGSSEKFFDTYTASYGCIVEAVMTGYLSGSHGVKRYKQMLQML